MQSRQKIGWISAAAVVVANMIGTGVFTTLGLQLEHLSNGWTIMLLWAIGGLAAWFGALTYAEIGSRLPSSGGEYHFLSRIYHPLLGYLSGWVSLTVGFAASIALAAMAIGNYLSSFMGWSGKGVAIASILLISAVHSVSIRQSSVFQNGLTLLKLCLIMAMIAAGFLLPAGAHEHNWSDSWTNEIFHPAFAISLVYVGYAFSGWNAAVYITGEIDDPRRNLPKALLSGALLVCLLFLLVQWMFLRQAPLELMRGKVEVAQVVAEVMFGSTGGKLVSLIIAALLVASISAMIWVGPRVTRAMAEEHRIWHFFAQDNRWNIPVRAIWLQTAISLFLVLTSSFEQVLLYSGFVLQLFTTITVFGLFILRRRQPAQEGVYLSPGYPWVQLAFLAFSGWMLIYLLIDKPFESLLGLLNLFFGAMSYLWNAYRFPKAETKGEADSSATPESYKTIVPTSSSTES